MTIEWTETVKSTGAVYKFAHHRSYDLSKQLYKDEELQNGKDLVQITVERPSLDGKAYQADMQRSACQNWTFTSLINGFVQTWADMTLEKTETFCLPKKCLFLHLALLAFLCLLHWVFFPVTS